MNDKRKSSKARLIKVLVSAYLEPEQAKRLADLSERTKVPQTALLREGLELVFTKYSKRTAK